MKPKWDQNSSVTKIDFIDKIDKGQYRIKDIEYRIQ